MIETGCIKIKLKVEDLNNLDISFEQMDYTNIETRRVIWTLLDAARRELHVDIDPAGRMLIEAIPNGVGGCVIYITELDSKAVKPRRMHMKKLSRPQIYEFQEAEDLLSAVEALCGTSGEFFQLSELYLMDKGYYLILYPDSPDGQAVPVILSQFSRLKGEGNALAAYAREHGKLLVSGNVMETIHRHFKPSASGGQSES